MSHPVNNNGGLSSGAASLVNGGGKAVHGHPPDWDPEFLTFTTFLHELMVDYDTRCSTQEDGSETCFSEILDMNHLFPMVVWMTERMVQALFQESLPVIFVREKKGGPLTVRTTRPITLDESNRWSMAFMIALTVQKRQSSLVSPNVSSSTPVDDEIIPLYPLIDRFKRCAFPIHQTPPFQAPDGWQDPFHTINATAFKILNNKGLFFGVQGRTLALKDILSPDGLLPIVSHAVAEQHALIRQKRVLLYFYPNQESLCEVSPGLDPDENSVDLPWGEMIATTLLQWAAHHPEALGSIASPIPLDDMYDAWFNAAKNAQLAFRETPSWRASSTKASPDAAALGSKDAEKTDIDFRPCAQPLGDFKNHEAFEVLVKNAPLRLVCQDVWAWQKNLDGRFPWMRAVTARLVRRLKIQASAGLPLRWPNMALVGVAGVGKSLYVVEALLALGHPMFVQNMGGTHDSKTVKGTNAGWSSAIPGLAAQCMATLVCGNPVVVLDDIDKTSESSENGNPTDGLLALLDVNNAKRYRDDCLQQAIDASNISWVMTLNDEALLPAALRSHVEMVQVSGPDWSNPEHVQAVLAMGEDLAWRAWAPELRTVTTRLSDEQKHELRRMRWGSLRSLGQSIGVMLEDNMYQAAVEQDLVKTTLKLPKIALPNSLNRA